MDVGRLFRQWSGIFNSNNAGNASSAAYIPLDPIERSVVEATNGHARHRASVSFEDNDDVIYEANELYTPISEEQKLALRRIPDDIPFAAFLIVVVEFCERGAFYGLAGVFQNYLQNPLPQGGPGTGAPASVDDPMPAGALGLGQAKASFLQQIVTAFSLVCQLYGAYVADARLGRYKTIVIFCLVYFVGLSTITITSLPASLRAGLGFPGWLIGALIIAFGSGGIKANVSPLIADQCRKTEPFIRSLSTGETVIVDPNLTIARIYTLFYWCINFGSLSAIITTQLERSSGFTAAFLLPLCLFLATPVIFILGKNVYHQVPPKGSILSDVWQVLEIAFRGALAHPMRFYREAQRNGLFARAKSNFPHRHNGQLENIHAPNSSWDDSFVDELERTAKASQISLFFIVYALAFNQMVTNLISQAGTMSTNGIPNDLIANFDPLALIVFIPLMDIFVYPYLQRRGIILRPLFRIWLGFMFAALAMVYSAVLQFYIYHTNPCGSYVSDCEGKSTISVWVQTPSYILIAISEMFSSITGLEYAYKHAPKRMKSVVMSFFMLISAIGTILTAALTPLAQDPHLVLNYAGIGVLTFIAGNIMYLMFWRRDFDEDAGGAIGKDSSLTADD